MWNILSTAIAWTGIEHIVLKENRKKKEITLEYLIDWIIDWVMEWISENRFIIAWKRVIQTLSDTKNWVDIITESKTLDKEI